MNVGLDAFEWIVFGDRNLLERGGVHHVVDAVERLHQPIAIAHVADEEAHLRRVELLRHLELLQFVAREDDDLPRLAGRQHRTHELAAERAGAPSDEDSFTVKQLHYEIRFFERRER